MADSLLPSMSALTLAVSQVRQEAARQSEPGSPPPRVPGADVEARLREAEQMVARMDSNLTAQRVALYQYQANLATLKTSDTVLGSLLSLSA